MLLPFRSLRNGVTRSNCDSSVARSSGYDVLDLSQNELAKTHGKRLIGTVDGIPFWHYPAVKLFETCAYIYNDIYIYKTPIGGWIPLQNWMPL